MDLEELGQLETEHGGLETTLTWNQMEQHQALAQSRDPLVAQLRERLGYWARDGHSAWNGSYPQFPKTSQSPS